MLLPAEYMITLWWKRTGFDYTRVLYRLHFPLKGMPLPSK